jgi:cytochrome c peroxidase
MAQRTVFLIWFVFYAPMAIMCAAEPQLGPLPAVQHPKDNPPSEAKLALGRKLFFDPRLSRNDKVSCATCHQPERGFASGTQQAVGIDDQRGTRHVPSLLNVAYQRSLFWDGRAATLEEQALGPIENTTEMDLPREKLVGKLRAIADYREAFAAVFGGELTAEQVAAALAAYQRTLVACDTPFDRYLAGEKSALSPAAERGRELFYGHALCSQCHAGAELTDHKYHNIGIGIGAKDRGRREVTMRGEDHAAFRTPALREVAHTAPYMHDGSLATLADVVRHYNFGGVTDKSNPHRDPLLEVLYLSPDQVEDLVAFLRDGLSSPKLPMFETVEASK